jgi:lipoprotein LprG
MSLANAALSSTSLSGSVTGRRQGVQRFLRALLIPVALLAGLGACSKDNNNEQLPDGATLITDSATASSSVNTTHIVIDVAGGVTSLPVKRVEGDLLRSGDAKGSIQLLAGTQLIGVDFVVSGDKLYLKYPTGGWTDGGGIRSVYDPSSILDPDRGIVKLLGHLTNARTDGSERIGGVDAYRVNVSVQKPDVSILLPLVDGVPADITGQVWIDKGTKHLLKAVFNTTANNTTAPPVSAGSITASFSNYDQPVTVDAPTT